MASSNGGQDKPKKKVFVSGCYDVSAPVCPSTQAGGCSYALLPARRPCPPPTQPQRSAAPPLLPSRRFLPRFCTVDTSSSSGRPKPWETTWWSRLRAMKCSLVGRAGGCVGGHVRAGGQASRQPPRAIGIARRGNCPLLHLGCVAALLAHSPQRTREGGAPPSPPSTRRASLARCAWWMRLWWER